MQLEQQVTSLELSQKLKKLGVKQEILFYWQFTETTTDGCTPSFGTKWKDFKYLLLSNDAGLRDYPTVVEKGDKIPAYTVAELLDLCPASTSMVKKTDLPTKKIPRYYVETFEHYRDKDFDENPANALAKMLIYLIENNLITLNK